MLTNKDFLKIMKQCCENGKVDDKKLNNYLSNYPYYELVFGKGEYNV